MRRALLAEALGAMLLSAAVIGSGIMAERLAGGNLAVALIANTGATVAGLAALIALLGPISGAHFNPAVSFIEALRGNLSVRATIAYAIVQIAGCVAGAFLAHAMFELPVIQISNHWRAGPAQWLSEAVATAGLILVVIGSTNPKEAAWRVAAWIGAAYWFTASTSFANPAITIARALSNTFAGIAPIDAPAFILSQLSGALIGLMLAKWLQIGTAPSLPWMRLKSRPGSPQNARSRANYRVRKTT
ncbi:MAG: MIP/aquaporin family protein [Steroidobacteraceae bacterium]|jgi:glycerol uptake facilitator-like aquaporin